MDKSLKNNLLETILSTELDKRNPLWKQEKYKENYELLSKWSTVSLHPKNKTLNLTGT